jgi:hypothetical protein
VLGVGRQHHPQSNQEKDETQHRQEDDPPPQKLYRSPRYRWYVDCTLPRDRVSGFCDPVPDMASVVADSSGVAVAPDEAPHLLPYDGLHFTGT